MGQSGEVLGVIVGAGESNVRVIFLLAAQVCLRLGHAPIAMSSWPMLLVKLQIIRIAGISGIAARDLDPRLGVAGEEGDVVFLRAARRVRPVRTIDGSQRLAAFEL